MNDTKKMSPGEETAEAIGRLKEAADQLKDEVDETKDQVSAEEAGSIVGAFLKGLWAILK